MNALSTFLFAEPSFTEGMARVLDMGGTLNLYNHFPTPAQADFWAISADWRAVGQDLRQILLAEIERLIGQGEGNVRPTGRPSRK